MKNNKITECKQIEKQIPLYLEDKLSPTEVSKLLEHVNDCKSCKEELTIQYMVTEGIKQAETENNYNLLKGLDDRLKDSVKQIKSHEFLVFAFTFCFVFIIFIIVAAIMKIML